MPSVPEPGCPALWTISSTASPPFSPDQALDLIVELARGRLLVEDEAGDGDGDDQERGEGEDGVVGQGGAEAPRLVIDPLGASLLQDGPE